MSWVESKPNLIHVGKQFLTTQESVILKYPILNFLIHRFNSPVYTESVVIKQCEVIGLGDDRTRLMK